MFVSGGVRQRRERQDGGRADIVADAPGARDIKRCLAAAAERSPTLQGDGVPKDVADREKSTPCARSTSARTGPRARSSRISRLVRDDLLIEIEATAVLPNGAKNGVRSPARPEQGHLRLKPASRTPLTTKQASKG